MSGLFGAVDFSGISRDELETRTLAAVRSLSHRGIIQNVWISECGKVALALASDNREGLSKSASGRSVMIFDGEVYNHQELREQHRDLPATSNDEALFLEMSERRGTSAFPLFEGAYASAVFDQSLRKILIAVDHAGQRPLYVYRDEKRVIFASEIKAIKSFGGADLTIHSNSLFEYLAYGFVPSPRTVFRNIRRLAPAHCQVIDLLEGHEEPKKYWDLPVLGPDLEGNSTDLQTEFRNLLRKSVKKRLSSQDAIGILLSGGVDSGAIAYEASQLGSQEKLKTFSLGFLKTSKSEIGDDSQFSRLVAAKIRSDHSEVQVDALTAQFDQLLRHFDEPVSSASFLPKSLLFREASRYMKVALGGFGSDLLFGGSANLQMALTVDEHLARLRSLLDWWPFSKLNDSVKTHIRFPLAKRLLGLGAVFSVKELRTLVVDNYEFQLKEAERLENFLTGLDKSRRAIYVNFHHFPFDRVMPLVDRTSALNGIRVRSPYLDKEVIEFAVLLPSSIRTDGRPNKSLVRDAYREILGSEVADRKKTEETFPLVDFLQTKAQSEDFHKLSNFGIEAETFPFNLKSSRGQNQFLTLYALEGFLKQLEISAGRGDERLTFRNNLQALFNDDKEGSLEWPSP